MLYYLRPNKLVKASRGGRIKSIATCACCCTTTFTLCTYPSHFATTCCFDIIQGRTPNKIKAVDVAVCSSCAGCVSANVDPTITFSTPNLKRLNIYCSASPNCVTYSVGDYVMSAQESIYPQMPLELQPVLAQRAAIHMLDSLGDLEGAQRAEKRLEQMELNMGSLIDNRVEGSHQKMVNKKGILYRTINSRYRRF